MVLRELGRSGLRVTPLGFGAFKIGRNVGIKYPQPYELPDEAAVQRLLNGVLDLGINYVDTAPAYGLSEERIGRFLGERRGEFVLSTKVGESFEGGHSTYDFSAAGVRASVCRSLERLRTARLDLVFIHAHADDRAILRDTEAVETLCRLRGEGLVRAIGLSAKTPEAALEALAWADVLMVEYHLGNRSFEPVIAQAAGRGVGIVVKKPLASGRLPAGEAIRFALSTPGVTTLVVGALNLDHIRENLQYAEQAAGAGAPLLRPGAVEEQR
jgi:aryl-alcohol dehydrogenase-like predicted oxidoreductase